MSQKSMEVVRQFFDGYDGKDVIPAMREGVEELGPTPEADAVLALWAEDPSWCHAHPDIEWDASAGGPTVAVRGAAGVGAWWTDWLETWESYVYRMVEYRDLGEWVLATANLSARGRNGIPVEMRVFQLCHVREDKVDACRVFLAEADALEAAGLRD